MPKRSRYLCLPQNLLPPSLTGKPRNDPGFNGREVCHDEFATVLGNECRADQLGQRIRDILIEHLHGIKITVADKASGFSQIIQVVLGQILHLNDAACPPTGAVGPIELEHPSGATIGAHSGLHCLVFLHRGLGKLLPESQHLLQFRWSGLQQFGYSFLPRVSVSIPLSESHCFICCTELGFSRAVRSFMARVSSERERPSI